MGTQAKQKQGRTPGALSAARVILRQVELLVDRPLADKDDTLDGIAAIIDGHTAAPDLLAALKECEAFLWGLAQEADQDNDPDWAENGPTYTLQVHVKDALAKAET